MADRVLVGFAGSRAGTAPVSWGQTAIWRAIQHLVPDDGAMNMSWITALEEEGVSHDTPLERITSTVALVMGRHESLCTRFPLDPSGEPQQVLADAGTVPVEIVDAGDTPPAQAAAALRDRLANPAFDYGTEWPWRIGVGGTGDVVTHAVFAPCHPANRRRRVRADPANRRRYLRPATHRRQPVPAGPHRVGEPDRAGRPLRDRGRRCRLRHRGRPGREGVDAGVPARAVRSRRTGPGTGGSPGRPVLLVQRPSLRPADAGRRRRAGRRTGDDLLLAAAAGAVRGAELPAHQRGTRRDRAG